MNKLDEALLVCGAERSDIKVAVDIGAAPGAWVGAGLFKLKDCLSIVFLMSTVVPLEHVPGAQVRVSKKVERENRLCA